MGMVVKRELNLEKMFNDFAVDPKKKKTEQKPEDSKAEEKKDSKK